MRTSIFVLFTVGLQALANQMIPGKLIRVIDGDTIVFSPNKKLDETLDDYISGSTWAPNKKKDLHIRMVGMDTPETHLPVEGGQAVDQGHWGTEATNELIALLGNEPLLLEEMGKDKYNRTLGRVFVGGRDVHLAMLKAGMAVTYFYCPNDKECRDNFMEEHKINEYVQACEGAQSAQRGIWDPTDLLPEMPFEFRMRHQNRPPDRFVGDAKTRKLYQPDDYKSVPHCRRIFFNTTADAKRLGFN